MFADGQPMDYLGGSFEFDIETGKEGDRFYAKAGNFKVLHTHQDQAINDLNALMNDMMERGEFTPQQ